MDSNSPPQITPEPKNEVANRDLSRNTSNEWRIRMQTGRQQRDQQWTKHAARYIDYYTNAFWFKNYIPGAMPSEVVPVNLVYPFVKTWTSSVYAKDPSFIVNPRREGDEQMAETLQMLLNYTWKELNLKEEFKLAIMDGLLTGWGWLKVGYQAEFGSNVTQPDQVSQKKKLKDIIQDVFKQVTGQTEKPGEDRQTQAGKVIEMNEYIKSESVFAHRISPFNIIVPWNVHRKVNWPWMAEDIIMYKKDVINNPALKNTDQLTPFLQSTLTGSGTARPLFGGGSSMNTGEPGEEMVRLTEIWDKRNQRRIIIGEGCTEPLMDVEWPYAIEGFPYVDITFNIVPETDKTANVFPMSPIAPAEPQLLELSGIRTHMSQHRKRFLAKYLIDKGAVSPDDLKKLEEPDEGGCVEVAGLAANPNIVRPLPPNPMDPAVLQTQNTVKDDLELIWGMSQLFFGQAPGDVSSATEAGIVAQAATVRVGEVQDIVEMATRKVAYHLLHLMRQFMDEEKVLRITNEQGVKWVKITPSENKADVDIEVEVGSTRTPQSALVDRKQLQDLIMNLVQMKQMGLVNPDFDYLVRQALKTYPVIKQVDRVFDTTLQDEQDLAAQETQLLVQGHPQVVHPKDNDEVHVQVHAAVASTPQHQQQAELMKMSGQIHPLDQHMLTHHQRMQSGARPTLAPQTSMPGGGATKAPDVLQGVRNAGKGTGMETNQTGMGA